MSRSANAAGDGQTRLAVYGGTFDPVHVGHLAIARAVLEAKAAEQVLFVPAGQQPLKRGAQTAPGQLRLAMLAAAIAGEPRFAVSPVELERAGPSYTLATLRALRDERPGAVISFVCGADALATLPHWYRPLELLAEFSVLAAERPGQATVAEAKAALAAAGFPASALARIKHLPAPHIAVSATEVRERVRQGLPLAGFVPAAVAALIERHGLYRSPAPG